jgi:hypothetical protein
VTGATSAGWTDNQKIGNQISDGETRDFFIPMLLDGVPFTHFSVECSATALVTILPSDLINTNPAHSHRPQ